MLKENLVSDFSDIWWKHHLPILLSSQNECYLQGYKFKACYDSIKVIIHCPSTKVECVTQLCPGDQLPPPCGVHPCILAVGVVSCLLYLLLVVVDVDIVILPELPAVQCRHEAE